MTRDKLLNFLEKIGYKYNSHTSRLEKKGSNREYIFSTFTNTVFVYENNKHVFTYRSFTNF
uniref:Uncharacterized protein n=1 Tax=viral metagenome TaxID=1070528 RepID=A0A6M3LC71_9ZZZZ